MRLTFRCAAALQTLQTHYANFGMGTRLIYFFQNKCDDRLTCIYIDFSKDKSNIGLEILNLVMLLSCYWLVKKNLEGQGLT